MNVCYAMKFSSYDYQMITSEREVERRFTFSISRLQQEANAALMAATQTPKHIHLREDENGEDDEMTNGDNGSGGGDVSRDLDTDENIKDPVEDRRTLAERNERLHDQLKVSMTACRFSQILPRHPRTFFSDKQFFIQGFETRLGSLA